MVMTKKEFIDKVLTFRQNGNAYGYKLLVSSTFENGKKNINVASKGNKLLLCIDTINSDEDITVILNTDTEEFHRMDEKTADRYLK